MAFRRIALLLGLLLFPLSSALWRLCLISGRQFIFYMKQTRGSVTSSVRLQTCFHKERVVFIFELLAVFKGQQTPAKRTKLQEIFHCKCSPLSKDKSLFITDHFALIHKFPGDSVISLTWCLDSRKKVLNASGPSCNLKLIKIN